MNGKNTVDVVRGGGGVGRRGLASVAVLTLAGGLGLVAGQVGGAPVAQAAAGDVCTINAVVVQDVTYSFSSQNLREALGEIIDTVRDLAGSDLPGVLGVTSFGMWAPVDAAPPFLGADLKDPAQVDALVAHLQPTGVGGPFWYDPSYLPDGTVNLHNGSKMTNWEAALREGKRAADEQGSTTILLVTDGVPNAHDGGGGGVVEYYPEAGRIAGDLMAELTAEGYTIAPVFVRTNGSGGVDAPEGLMPTPEADVVAAMQNLSPGWSMDEALQIDEFGAWLRDGALLSCSPQIDLVKSHRDADVTDVNGNGLVDAGDTVVFTFDVTNTGDLPLSDVTVTDPVLTAAGVSLQDEGRVGRLGLGESARLRSAPYTITLADVVAGGVENVATATGVSEGGEVTDTDEDVVTTAYFNSIELVKSHEAGDITDVNGNGLVDAGDTVVFRLEVTNTGSLALTDVIITDEMLAAAGVSLQDEGRIGDLAAGDSVTILSAPYTLTQADVDAGELVNVATVVGTPPVGTPPSDEDIDRVVPAGLPGIALKKSHEDVTDVNGNDRTDVGDEVTFTFEVTNIGSVTLTDVVVSDEILAAAGVELEDLGVIGDLAPGQSVTIASAPYTLTQADVDAGEHVNVATVAGTPPTGDPVTDDDDDEVPTATVPGIALVKSHKDADVSDVNGNGRTDEGDTVVFTFEVTNTGNTTLDDVVVSDPTLTERGVSLADDGTIGSLAPGESRTITSEPTVLTAQDVTAGGLHNTATTTGTPPTGDPVTDDDDDTVPTDPTVPTVPTDPTDPTDPAPVDPGSDDPAGPGADDPADPGTTGSLASTGASTGVAVAVAAALTLAGAGAVLGVRRRTGRDENGNAHEA
ncbi:DUF7507 domain-containing protein [Cellulosimicrobium composti]|uniref:DUF7507 domain-containing protein n=1 Tax=Cellulosimicrobium composti TaxID=2672572 RepID=UPI00379B6566